METAVLNVGFDNAVMASRVVAIIAADPSPIRRLREAALRDRKLIDATNGRRTRAVIVTDSDHVVLSSLQPETVLQRLTELLHEAAGRSVPAGAAAPAGAPAGARQGGPGKPTGQAGRKS